ncbi:MAG: HAMP domain-containing protein [Desulfovibrio sp.]|nr:HAMP domain-containing protein [Desulfovibrio sp.]
MKNLKMALKIGLGFSLVVGIMVVLSLLAINAMKDAQNNAGTISEARMPELVAGVHIDRAASDALANMLRYGMREEMQFANEARKHLDTIREELDKAEKLVMKYPELVKLKASLSTVRPVMEAYAKQVDKTVELTERLKQRRQELITLGERFLGHLTTMLADQNQRIDTAIANGESAAEIGRRLYQTRHINTLLDLGAAVRISNFQSQVLREPKIAEEGLAMFPEIMKQLKELGDSVRRPEAREEVRVITEAGEKYAQGFRALIEDWKAIQALSVERLKNIDALLENAQAMSRNGLDQTLELCAASESTAEGAVTTLTIGMAIGVVLSIILAFLLTRAITGPLHKSVDFATAVAGGELNKTLDIHQQDEVGHLADALNSMVATLRQRIQEAQEAIQKATAKEQEALTAMREADEARKQAEQAKREGMLAAAGQLEDVVANVSSASEQLSVQAAQSTEGSQRQAARASETATAMEEMNATVLEVARNAGDTAQASEQAKQKAQSGSEIVQQVIKGMQRIQVTSEELRTDMADLSQKATNISAIMDVISDIADQTNLLALNAAIEAARAGEAGRGFAVVADEVRKLAEKTMNATAEVGQAIQGIQQGTAKNMANAEASLTSVNEVTELAARSGEALNEIVHLVDQAADQVRAIATASEEQSATSEEINRAIDDINQISTETAAAMQLASQAVSDLSQQAQVLNRLIVDMKNS